GEPAVLRLWAGRGGARRNRAHGALRRAVHVQLAVLPVRHRRPRFERLVARIRTDERLVENEISLLESGLDISDLPLVGMLSERKIFRLGPAECLLRPLPPFSLPVCRVGRLRRPPP